MNKPKNQHKGQKRQKLYPMSSFGVVSGMTKQIRITKLEDRLTPVVAFPHKHSFYHLVIITKGQGTHSIDFKSYKAEKGSVFFMLPAQVHSWDFSKETTGIVIEFERLNLFFPEEENVVLSQSLRPMVHHLESNKTEELVSIAEEMLVEYSQQKNYFEMNLQLKLGNFLIEYLRQAESATKNKDSKSKISVFGEQFLKVVEEYYKSEHSVEFYAHYFDLTAKSLTAKVNRHLGKSVRDAIQERCLLESKRLLAYSDLTISEISRNLGFEDANYFTRFFKLKSKQSPSDFRRLMRK